MSDVVTIGAVTTPVVSYKDQRVCTTQQLAQFYGCDPDSIQKNFERNASRFEEGKHFFKIMGAELRRFKSDQPTDSRLVPKRSPHLILWAERGAARHAKMLSTDKAWDVFEQLEDNYFVRVRTRAPLVDGGERSSKRDRLPLYHFAVDTVIKHHLPFSKAYVLINLFAGTRSFKEMSRGQSAEVADFCDRFALGQDTRNDWQRITDNQTKLYGTPQQLDMVQRLLLS
ncbi:hypothetical protein GmRootV59_13370 [Variovorax sp. V59]|uniref:ORF6N domain-containing protein n=1 Tax=unclassified Variovorax TaxID=663243 RepID=UPI0034E8EA23